MEKKLVALVMGSQSDWETLKHCAEMLDTLKIPYDTEIISAHRTPDKLHQFSEDAEMQGLEVIIAGAGGAAHLPGMIASKTLLPVLGVPMQSSSLNGLDSLLSIVQMPAGVPVGTLAIGKAGAINAALFAASILGASHPKIREHFKKFREAQTEKVLKNPDPREGAK
jgi:5-(carboxyamino)imidazole ribonucleotide mutase